MDLFVLKPVEKLHLCLLSSIEFQNGTDSGAIANTGKVSYNSCVGIHVS